MQTLSQNKMLQRTCLAVVIILGLSIVHFAFPNLIGLDGYFHIRYSHLLRTQGLIEALPWLSATIYAKDFVDDHFLFHALQVPFTFGNLILGAKLYGLVVATAIFLLFYHILSTHRIAYPALWTLALFVSAPIFLLRITMPRAPGISLFILLLATYLILSRKDRWMGPLAFVYVWTYGGFPLLSVLAGCAYLVSFIYEKENRWQLLFATGLGTVLGLIINPYFPHNLYFLYLSYTDIELGMSPTMIPSGTEDYPYAASSAIRHTLFVWVILFTTLVLYITRPLVLKPDVMMLFLFSIILLCLYLNVRRFIEYWPPFSLLFSAFALNEIVPKFSKHRPKLMASLTIIALALASVNTVQQVRILRTNEYEPRHYAGAAAYLHQHTPKNSIVFTGDWDDFPILFFHNTHNYYIVGMGLHYLYFYDPNLFTRWMDITEGLISNSAEAIRKGFQAQYAFCLRTDVELLHRLETDPQAHLLYQDDHASVFELIP